MDAEAVGAFMREWGRRTAALHAGTAEAAIPPCPHPPSFDRSFMTRGMEDALRQTPALDHIFRIRPEGEKGAEPTTGEEGQQAAAPPAGSPHVIGRVYHFPRAELEALRQAAGGKVSLHDALFAHLAQVIGRATGTVGEEAVMVCQAVNGRRVFSAKDFFGSCAFWLHHRTTNAAVQASLPVLAAAVHAAHATPDRRALLAYGGYMAAAGGYERLELEARITSHDYPRGELAAQRNGGRGLRVGDAVAGGAGAWRLRALCDLPGWSEGECRGGWHRRLAVVRGRALAADGGAGAAASIRARGMRGPRWQ